MATHAHTLFPVIFPAPTHTTSSLPAEEWGTDGDGEAEGASELASSRGGSPTKNPHPRPHTRTQSSTRKRRGTLK